MSRRSDKKSLLDDSSEQHCNVPLDSDASELSPLKSTFAQIGEEFRHLPTETVRTSKGDVLVAIQGDPACKQVMITLHDIGLNHLSCFQSFFSFHQMRPLVHQFCIFHINFPGQEEDAEALPENFGYPSMSDMAVVVEEVVQCFGIKYFVGLGIGAGANVLIRVGLNIPKKVDGLILINSGCTTAGWSEWGYQKVSSYHLRNKGMTVFAQDHLMWHYFGKIDEETSMDLVSIVKDHISSIRYPKNLAFFIDSYVKRTNIKMVRPESTASESHTLKTNVLLICGARSPHVDDTVTLNSRLDPKNSTWMKISDASGMVVEEQPTVVTNAIILFLQGLGKVLKLKPPSLPQHQASQASALEGLDVQAAIC